MISSVRVFAFERDLPAAAAGTVAIVRTLADAGHEALLAGGCVRDLLLGRTPEDYDVATDAPPQRVAELFKATRKVGVLRIALPKAAKARARKVEVKTA
jgi:poly(A) polymerase